MSRKPLSLCGRLRAWMSCVWLRVMGADSGNSAAEAPGNSDTGAGSVYVDYCPGCGEGFSDWFTWTTDGMRFCYPCWYYAGMVFLEDGSRFRDGSGPGDRYRGQLR